MHFKAFENPPQFSARTERQNPEKNQEIGQQKQEEKNLFHSFSVITLSKYLMMLS